MEKSIYDKELGAITLRTSARAKRYSLKVSKNTIVATMPVWGDEKILLDFINNSRRRLLDALAKLVARRILLSDTSEIQTNTFKLHIFRADGDKVRMNLQNGILHIACPHNTDFNNEAVQQLLQDLLKKALLHEAKRVLPERLKTLAERHGFSYTHLRIGNAKKRWGSCSIKRNINLSLSLMLLPDRLIDYVILHELCHTVEMNHGERFWKRLDAVTSNQARALSRELRSYEIL
jgi:predicted metal-dependent hydrolase